MRGEGGGEGKERKERERGGEGGVEGDREEFYHMLRQQI